MTDAPASLDAEFRGTRALLRASAGALLAVTFVACHTSPSLTEDPRPWERGQVVSDPALEELLKPDVPVESSGLHRGTDGRVYYVARFENDPPRGYQDRYPQLIP